MSKPKGAVNVRPRPDRVTVLRKLSDFPAPTPLDSPCRLWQGVLSASGYGVRSVGNRRVVVHRWVVAQIDGWDAIEGKVVMHLCDNKLCYRYDHLRIGTHSENHADMMSKGRNGNGATTGSLVPRTHCKNGHEFTSENTYIRPDTKARQCRQCRADRQGANR